MPKLTPYPFSLPLLVCAVLLAAGPADAKTPTKRHVTQRRAERAALAKVPDGRVRSSQLQTVQGKEVWVVDISRPGKSNGREVRVDAHTGKVVGIETERPGDQAEAPLKTR